MSFNGSGVAVINSAGQPVVASTLITAVAMNALTADLASMLSTCVLKDGTQTITANIPFGGFKATGMAAGTVRTDSATLANVQDGTGVYVGTVGGTADVITLTASPAIAAYVAGQTFRFIAGGTNTTNVTVAVSGLVARAITKNGTTPLVAGDIPAGAMVQITGDGTRFILGTTGAATVPPSVLPISGGTLTGNLAISVSDARTNTVASPFTITSQTSGTPAAGIGTGLILQAESGDEAPSNFGGLSFAATDITAGSEDTYFQVFVRVAGAVLSEAYRFIATTAFKAMFTHANSADRTYTLPNATGSIPTIAAQSDVNAMTSTAMALTPNHNIIVLGAVQNATSGTSIDFTAIPAGVRRITVMFVGVSTSGTDAWLIQIGDAGGIETTGYLGVGSNVAGATNSTAGLLLRSASAAHVANGQIVLSMVDAATFTWVLSGILGYSNTNEILLSGASKFTSAELDRVRITTTGGTDTFDAGLINISYER